MRPAIIYALSCTISALGLAGLAFVYWTQPKTFSEAATKGQVIIGTYSADQTELARAIELFRREDFTAARAAFEKADPERRDAKTQFYLAYCYYRQGWGRISNDDELFRSGLEAANRSLAIDPQFRAEDSNLGMQTASELRNELEEGLKVTASDFNPLRLIRERK